ncbi:MAG: hypothetical protein G01um101431_952 [Parcubacteria group bacterium Gr01-1014_31]|nr:MAG: hypothetical protein G01um101431_952 [Parcubacteria group bacterium Gr01-1014_31]
MKVFIEKTAGLNQVKSDGATKVMRDYPYPYGYILDTTSGDGENVDCYVITQKKLDIGSIVDAEPVGLDEYFEDGMEDHKVLAALENEPVTIDAVVRGKLNEFAMHFFDHRPEKVQRGGNFYGKDRAEEYIRKNRVKQ